MQDWLTAVTALLDTEEVRVTTQEIIPEALTEAYDWCYARVLENGTNKAESEKAQYMYLFAIYSKKLWRAKYTTWEEFLDNECHANPLIPHKTSIKTAMTAIKDLLEKSERWKLGGEDAGQALEEIATALVNAPTATRILPTVPKEQLPEKDYSAATIELGSVDGSTGLSMVTHWSGKPTIKCTETFHDERNARFLFKVKIRPADINEATIERDGFISDVDSADYADWLQSRFKPAKRHNDN